MTECPTCQSTFDSKRSMKIHHSAAHDESIAKKTSECSICKTEFKYYPSSKQGKYCSECVDKQKHKQETILTKSCPECGCFFETPLNQNTKYCSQECYATSITSPRETNCSSCGKDTTNYPEDEPLCEHCVQRVQRTNRRRELIEMKGGGCEKCGYDENISVLSFHHRNPEIKNFNMSGNNLMRKWDDVLEEAEKCVLLCRNCHRESHCTGSKFCHHEHGRFGN